MAIKRKRRKRRKKRAHISLFNNLVILSLFILVFGFLGSMLDRLLFNNGSLPLSKKDLSEMIASTKYELRTGHKIEIEIQNGCGVAGLANIYTDFLRAEGYDVLDSKNAQHFSYSQSLILHHNDDYERALSLANTMGVSESQISVLEDENKLHDLTLIIGQDYRSLRSYEDAQDYIGSF